MPVYRIGAVLVIGRPGRLSAQGSACGTLQLDCEETETQDTGPGAATSGQVQPMFCVFFPFEF